MMRWRNFVTNQVLPETYEDVGTENASSNGSCAPTLHPDVVARAFEELFRAHHSVLVAAAFNRLSDLDDAEEAVSEVFAAAWRRRTDHATTFTLPWLYATLRNVVGNEYRRRDRAARRVRRFAIKSPSAVVQPPDDEAIALRKFISGMRPDDRELLWMAYWEELTGEEMAVILGCSRSAIKVRLLRARGRLKELLRVHDRTDSERRGQ